MQRSIVLLSLIFLIFSCEDEETKITFSEKNFTTNQNKIVEINIPQAEGVETVKNNINASIEAMISASLNLDEDSVAKNMSISESIDKFNSEYASFKSEFPESALEWEAQIDGEIMYQSEAVISVVITNYLNTGGAHGSLVVSFLNFDALTGQSLKNEQLFNDMNAFKTVAEDYFNDQIADKKELYFEPDNFVLPQNIGFNDTGVILLYNSYEVAPYSTGLTEFTIPFDDLVPYLNFM
ncbi:PdaC/SigV domain-containing protein [Bizionia hallyeonensis]|uniref:PdaC/SigV domain-containing protein n=1 Tax=Bizionia hallyeonensis TaxID=1123757 RepID=A0ABW0C2A1_9FLAO